MKTSLTFGALAAALALCPIAFSQTAAAQTANTGFSAGDIMVRARLIGVIPQNWGSSVSAIGGNVSVTAEPAPEVDISYYLTPNISVEAIAASTRHEVSAKNTVLGTVDVGSAYVLPPTVTAQYHFFPKSDFNPYIGAGLTLAFFYDTHPAGGAVTSYGLSNNAGGAVEIGADYHITGPWYFNVDYKQIFLATTARLDGGAIVAHTNLDPSVVGAGIGFKF